MAQITVNGRGYDLVTLDELTLDEAMVVWEYAKLSLDQIPDLEGFHPGLIAALIHVSVARAEPGETTKTIRQVVGSIKVVDLQTVFHEISEEVEGAPSSKRARADLEEQRFWRRFVEHWGDAPGVQPGERFWQPWLGHWCHLRPCDLGGMTPAKLEACHAWVKAQS